MYTIFCLGLTLIAFGFLIRGVYLIFMVTIGKRKPELFGKGFQDTLIAMFLSAFVGYLINNPPLTLVTVLLILKLLFILFLVIGLHEAGHFFAARILKIPIKVFTVGVGPTIFKIHKNNTLYQLKILPVGGYVRVVENAEDKLSLISKSFFYLAGILVNLACFVIGLGISTFVNGKGFIEGITLALNKVPMAFQNFYQLLLNLHYSDIITPEHDLENSISVYISFTQFAEQFWAGFAIMSLILAILNTVPIPIADGGRVVLAFLSSILKSLRAPEKFIQSITYALLISGVVIYFTPILLNNVWSNSQKIGVSLVEYLLWIGLAVSVLMNISIYFENKNRKTVN